MADKPCPNMPTQGLQRLRGDFKQCPSPWICGKLGCQAASPDDFNAKPLVRKRSLRERVERVNSLLRNPARNVCCFIETPGENARPMWLAVNYGHPEGEQWRWTYEAVSAHDFGDDAEAFLARTHYGGFARVTEHLFVDLPRTIPTAAPTQEKTDDA